MVHLCPLALALDLTAGSCLRNGEEPEAGDFDMQVL